MRPRLEILGNTADNRSFTGYKVSVPYFEFFWHFHPEYELTFIVNGKGNRLVGNHIQPFESGDFVLIGPNLPHVWISDEKDTAPCEALVIQFPEACMQNLLHFPECTDLHRLVQHAGRGLSYAHVPENERGQLTDHMQRVVEGASFSGFIELLCMLAAKEGMPVSTGVFSSSKPAKDSTRLQAVLHFIQMHYQKSISLRQVAASIHLSESAFSKFFIREMGKPFTTYLNELRIAHACRLLMETDMPVSLIAQASGFENTGYFNRVFLAQKKVTPTGLRKIRKRK
jgi:YesN/AraC family two-component response regulator